MPNYLSRWDADSLPSFSECVHFNGTKVLFTPLGIQRYRERFARAGFDIAKIDDAEELQRALEGSWHIEMECFAEVSAERRGPGDADPFEKSLRLALNRGDEAEAERITKKLEHRSRAALSAVKSR